MIVFFRPKGAKWARIFLDSPLYHQPVREPSARQAIFRRMHREFELAGVWPSMRRGIQVSQYTHRGDPLKIDCGYRFKTVVKMFHATPLRTN